MIPVGVQCAELANELEWTHDLPKRKPTFFTRKPKKGVSFRTRPSTNPTAMPLLLQDTNTSDAARFYRLQLGP